MTRRPSEFPRLNPSYKAPRATRSSTMRHLLLAVSLTLPLAQPAAAASTVFGSENLNLILGYRAWINNWTSWNTGATNRPHYSAVSQGGVANNFSATLRYKQLFTNLGYYFTGDYNFPRFVENDNTAVTLKAKRNEIDWNLGFMVVPQLGFTVGLKNVNQKWIGAASTQDWNYLGPTLGIVGNAAIGKGFSLYGNGAGGFMNLTIDNPSNAGRQDKATYESAELGVAWKPASAPISASFGYKFQKLSTKLDIAGYENLRGIDLTTGYILGLNLIF